MEERLDKLEKTVNEGFQKMEKGFQQLNDLCLNLIKNQAGFDGRLDKFEARLDNVEAWQEEAGKKMDTLQNTMNSFVSRTVKNEEEIIVIAHRQKIHEDRIEEIQKKIA